MTKDAAFCFCCRLFPPSKRQTENIFTEVGYRQWKKANEKEAGFRQHERSDFHVEAFCAWKEFNAHISKGATIDRALVSAQQKVVNENKHYIKQIAKVLMLTARQKIAQRGHREDTDSLNKGNFLEILELLSENDEVVRTRLKGSQRVKYTSPQIQNEILQILGQMIITQISNEVNESIEFSVMMDESKDISKREQLSVVIRYVHNNCVHEEFLGFIRLAEMNAEYMKNKLCGVLGDCGIDAKNCVGQTYDGASVMSGCNKGVQTLFREEAAPQAVYIHCYNHRLNLVIVDCVKSVTMGDNFFTFLEQLYVYISSHVPYELYLVKQKEMYPGRQPRVLKRLSDTRWACQYNACKVIMDTLPCILQTLTELAENHSGKRAFDARCLLNNITFSTIVCLIMFSKILQQTKLISDMLQSPSVNLAAAADHIDVLQSDLKEQRNAEPWHMIWEEAAGLAKEVDISVESIPTKRTKRRPGRLDSSVVMSTVGAGTEMTCEDEFKIQLYYPVMDVLLSELDRRFNTQNKMLLKSIASLDPTSGTFLNKEALLAMVEQYHINDEYLEVELKQAQRLIETKRASGTSIGSIGELGGFMKTYQDAFPDLNKLINIALVLPPTSASCERSFSSMRLIKSYLRNTMGDSKLSSLAVIGIHPGRARNIDMDNFVSLFIKKHNNRSLQLF